MPRSRPPATAMLLAVTALIVASALFGCDAERATTPADSPTLGNRRLWRPPTAFPTTATTGSTSSTSSASRGRRLPT